MMTLTALSRYAELLAEKRDDCAEHGCCTSVEYTVHLEPELVIALLVVVNEARTAFAMLTTGLDGSELDMAVVDDLYASLDMLDRVVRA